MIGQTVSHFRITSELGQGGMGVVYKAEDTKLRVDRALKFLHPDAVSNRAFRARFLAEARALARRPASQHLSHPGGRRRGRPGLHRHVLSGG